MDLRKLDWEKYPDNYTYAPLIKKNEFIEGSGHKGVIFNEGKCYIVYHGRDYRDIKGEEDARSAKIDEMLMKGKRLAVITTP